MFSDVGNLTGKMGSTIGYVWTLAVINVTEGTEEINVTVVHLFRL